MDVWFSILMPTTKDLRVNNHKEAHLMDLVFTPILLPFYLPFWKPFLFIELPIQIIYAFMPKIALFLQQFQNLIKEPN